MDRLRKVLSLFAAAALLLPAGRALARKPVFQHHRADHEGEEREHNTNRSAKPSKGTASGLTLHSRSLLDKAGKTEVEISTAPFDIGAVAPGNIKEVDIRAVDPRRRDNDDDGDDKDGKDAKDPKRVRFHKEYDHLREGGYVHWFYTGLPHAQALRIKAEARAAAHGREVEARWLDTVRYRPDLVVTMVDAPGMVPVNALVQVSATVREGMGELGAHADCVLFVDNVKADDMQGHPIWVDAAGVSTCQFTTEFKSAGAHSLTVRVQNVKPGDYDDSNNSFTRQIQVQSAATLYWDLSVQDQQSVVTNTRDSYYTSTSATPEQHFVETSNSSGQTRLFWGTIPAAVGTVSRISFTDRSGGKTLASNSFDSPKFDPIVEGSPDTGGFFDPSYPNSSVFNDFDLVTGRAATVVRYFNATTNQGYTQVSVAWSGSDATYFSKNTCAALALGCQPGDSAKLAADGTMVTLGDDYAADFEMQDGALYSAHPTMPLPVINGSTTPVVSPWTCQEGVDFHTGTLGKVCTQTSTLSYLRQGDSFFHPPATPAN
jgi:hypothetical protein